MPLHHYLPATFLASFSADSSTHPRRKRLVCVGDKQNKRTFRAPAANIAAVNNLYTLVAAGDDPQMVDNIWTEYEANLQTAVELLIEGETDARTWVRVLVPFVACLLVRGPDFNRRFERRMDALGLGAETEGGHLIDEDNTNTARLFELQRLLGPVAVAKWVVIQVRGQEPLITNDLGYAPFVNRATEEAGMAIPLDPSHVLAVIPRTEGRVAVVRSGNWVPEIEYTHSSPGNHEGLNRVLSSSAQRFLFGPDETVGRWLRGPPASLFLSEPRQLGFITGPLAVAHEFTWHRLAPAVERDPSDGAPWDFSFDWEGLSRGWAPPVLFPTNLVEFPPALRREGQSISVQFYDPAIYFALSRELGQK